jgi:hypothetical protein
MNIWGGNVSLNLWIRIHVSLRPYGYFHHSPLDSVVQCLPIASNQECFVSSLKSWPTTRHGGAWREMRYSSYSFSTSALAGGECSASRPSRALAQGIGPQYPLYRRPVWTQMLEEKLFRLCRGSNSDRPVVQHVAKNYTDWATRLTL